MVGRGAQITQPGTRGVGQWAAGGALGCTAHQVHPKKLKLAMALRGGSKHYRVAEIHRRHFNATAKACGFASDMAPIIESVIAMTPAVVAQVAARLPKGFPEALFAAITGGLERSAALLASMPR